MGFATVNGKSIVSFNPATTELLNKETPQIHPTTVVEIPVGALKITPVIEEEVKPAEDKKDPTTLVAEEVISAQVSKHKTIIDKLAANGSMIEVGGALKHFGGLLDIGDHLVVPPVNPIGVRSKDAMHYRWDCQLYPVIEQDGKIVVGEEAVGSFKATTQEADINAAIAINNDTEEAVVVIGFIQL